MADDREEEITELSVLVGEQPGHSSVDKNEQHSSGDDICIVVAGKPGNGKSTALNNIFALNLPTKMSFRSVTTKIEKKNVTKRNVITKNDVKLTVVDTPGLGALDIDKETITMAMVEILDGVDYTLLYCLAVGPGNRLTEMDKTIIRNLYSALGKEVWDKCVILFTFSDTARRDGFKSADQVSDYKEYIEGVAAEFYEVLKSCSSDVPVRAVKSIFKYEGSGDIFNRTEEKKVIVAIPVGKNVDQADEPEILPNILEPTDDWTDLVFVELMRKTKEKHRRSFLMLKYGAAVASGVASGATAGAVVGAAAGAVLGAVGGPVGVVVAAPAGAAIGAGVGAALSISIASIATAIRMQKRKRKIKDLLPERCPADPADRLIQ